MLLLLVRWRIWWLDDDEFECAVINAHWCKTNTVNVLYRLFYVHIPMFMNQKNHFSMFSICLYLINNGNFTHINIVMTTTMMMMICVECVWFFSPFSLLDVYRKQFCGFLLCNFNKCEVNLFIIPHAHMFAWTQSHTHTHIEFICKLIKYVLYHLFANFHVHIIR